VLVLAGRHDRTCSVAAAQAIADGVPGAELVVFERSGHMTYVEEDDAYVAAVRGFLARYSGLTSAAAASAASSCSRTRSRPLDQNDGSVRSRPGIAARSSGLREPPAASSSR
jgi:TAP-like protein